MTLDEAIGAFVAEAVHHRAAAGTRISYATGLNRFFKAARVDSLDGAKAVTEGDVPKVIKRLEKDYRPATVAATVSAARQFYKALHVEDPEFSNPLANIDTISVPDNVPEWNVLHEGKPTELLAIIKDLHHRALVTAMVMQGWRVSDCCNLKWQNVRQEAGYLVVQWKGKRKKLRNQRLQAVTIEAIRALKGSEEPNTPLLPKPDGAPYTRFGVYGIVKRYAKKIGVEVTPHGLRATYLSSVIKRKGIEAARQLGGHASIATTQRYSRWVVDADDELTVEDL